MTTVTNGAYQRPVPSWPDLAAAFGRVTARMIHVDHTDLCGNDFYAAALAEVMGPVLDRLAALEEYQAAEAQRAAAAADLTALQQRAAAAEHGRIVQENATLRARLAASEAIR